MLALLAMRVITKKRGEENARTSRYHRECRACCQRRVCSPTPPTNAAPCHLRIYVSIRQPLFCVQTQKTRKGDPDDNDKLWQKKKSKGLLTFEEMVQTSVPGYLKFGPNAHRSSARFGDLDTLQDTFHISLLDTHTCIFMPAQKVKQSFSQFVPARESGQAHLEVHRPLIQRAILYDKERAGEVAVEREGTLPSGSNGETGVWGYGGAIGARVPVRIPGESG